MGHKFILPVAPPDQGTRRTMVLHTLLPCGSSLTYREMPEARCGRWCTLTDTIISRTIIPLPGFTSSVMVQQIMISHYATQGPGQHLLPGLEEATSDDNHLCSSVYSHSQQ